MSKNIRILLVHDNAPPTMRQLATRVIDGSLLKAATLEGRMEEAKGIYNRMMGIKSSIHPYEIEETDEDVTQLPPLPERVESMETKILEQQRRGFAESLAEGIAAGVASAMKESKKEKAPKEEKAETPPEKHVEKPRSARKPRQRLNV